MHQKLSDRSQEANSRHTFTYISVIRLLERAMLTLPPRIPRRTYHQCCFCDVQEGGLGRNIECAELASIMERIGYLHKQSLGTASRGDLDIPRGIKRQIVAISFLAREISEQTISCHMTRSNLYLMNGKNSRSTTIHPACLPCETGKAQ